MSAGRAKITVKVVEISKVNDLVTRFSFERIDGALLPTFSGGAHIVVEMKDGDINRLNPYSLMSDPMNQSRYSISVRRDDAGRGGSLFMQEKQFNSISEATVYGLGSGVGWFIAVVLIAAIRERIRYANIPGPLRGVGMAFLITGLMGLAFLGFMGFEFE